MNPIFVDLGIIQIKWYSITMLTAIAIGTTLFYKGLKKLNYDDEFIINLIFGTIICGIIGARFYYVIFELDYYLKHLNEIVQIWNGGLAIHGAVFGGAIWILYYVEKKKINFFKISDVAVISLLISQAIGRWGNFFNSEAHGTITTLETLKSYLIPNFIINGMNINGVYYHPAFYYEMLWNVLGFIIVLILNKKIKLKTGILTGIYFIWYSIIRFFLEGIRTDSLMLGNIRVAQLVSVVLYLIGMFLVIYNILKKEKK